MPSTYRPITARLAADLLAGKVPIGQGDFIRCTAIAGFCIVGGATRHSYAVEGRAGRHGRNVRQVIGPLRMDFDEARTQARERLAELARGTDTVAELRRQKMRTNLTGKEAIDALAGVKAQGTRDEYERCFKQAGWLDVQLERIGAKVGDYYAANEGATSAKRNLRAFSAVWNATAARLEEAGIELGPCPTTKLTRQGHKGWRVAPRKRRLVADELLPAWMAAVCALDRDDVSDLLLFYVYTGARASEPLNITKADVNMVAKTFTLRDTKTGGDVTLPATKQVLEILERRVAAVDDNDAPIFPVGDVRKSYATVTAITPWSPSDARRQFITACRRVGLDDLTARALTNHAAPAGDAHAGYFIRDPDALRGGAQRACDFIDGLAVRKRGNVSSIAAAKKRRAG